MQISIFNFAVYLLLFFSKLLIKQSRNRINVIRRKRNSTKKFLKQDTIDLLANHLQIAYNRLSSLASENKFLAVKLKQAANGIFPESNASSMNDYEDLYLVINMNEGQEASG
ncbi:uncharacterized protein DS421_20g692000 [Arachis hypogaea]|nr:uncharacterized protein DS421_20g692000 [Arachis hypogaea]